jgi:hypothetical protein
MNMLDFLLLILGGVMGFWAWLTYRRLPSAWLVEYGETVVPPELEPGQRTRFLPDGLFLVMLSAILVTAGWQRSPPLVLFILYVLASCLMLVILLADWKTRIIPDPLLDWPSWLSFMPWSRFGIRAGHLPSWAFAFWPVCWPESCFC